jgi:hypothetical protein
VTAIAVAALLAACPAFQPVAGAPGAPTVLHVPAAAALALNNEGKALYRQDRWEEARAKYQAALAADPEFLAPALNAACALARQDRFAEAADEAAALVRRAYVPWGREALEAADLAGLHVRPQMATLRAALAQAGPAWGQSLMDGLFFVARSKPPVRLDGQGVLVLGMNQELFAWLPRSGRYRQVTADDGRVLAAIRSGDGRTVVYVRAGKLVRAAGAIPVLRGLSLRRLDVPTMHLDPPIDVPGDVQELALGPAGDGYIDLRLVGSEPAPRRYRLIAGALVPLPAVVASAPGRVVRLTAAGVEGAGQARGPAGCAYAAADEAPHGKPRQLRITAGKASIVVPAPFGAGLFGLPFVPGR